MGKRGYSLQARGEFLTVGIKGGRERWKGNGGRRRRGEGIGERGLEGEDSRT